MKLDVNDLIGLKSVAVTAAKEAGRYIQSKFNTNIEKRSKKGGDTQASQIVTEVDLEAQRIILTQLKASIESYDLGLLTEESADKQSRLSKDYFWCIDPMDGTLPYTEGKTGYAISIALVSRDGDPVLGAVYIPDLDQCFSSNKGDGVQLNEQNFLRNELEDDVFHIYMDRSFQSERYFEFVESYIPKHLEVPIEFHFDYGGVRNAIAVMQVHSGCYFKFPKDSKGCGSIWDYAATRLFFEELNLHVSDAYGEKLFLNNPETLFMNDVGIAYATDNRIFEMIELLRKKVRG